MHALAARASVERYFQAWKARDEAELRRLLDDRISFAGPMGRADGVDSAVAGLLRLARIVTDFTIDKVWVDEADIITWYHMRTRVAEPFAIANWMRMENGKIRRMRVLFDPRLLLEGMAGAPGARIACKTGISHTRAKRSRIPPFFSIS